MRKIKFKAHNCQVMDSRHAIDPMTKKLIPGGMPQTIVKPESRRQMRQKSFIVAGL